MEAAPQSPVRFAFGPFEVNALTGELRKHGLRIRLPGQPFQILLILLAHAGEMVSRSELTEEIWGLDTVVDFDQSLNTAINKVRRALGDSAERPRYIETVAGRGYRFVGALQPVSTAAPPGISLVDSPALPADTVPSYFALPGRKGLWKIMMSSAVVLGAVAAGFLSPRRGPTLRATDTIVMGDFNNMTGDPVFDGALRPALTAQLEESPFRKVVSDDRVHKFLGLMNQPTDAQLTPQVAREICERTGGAAVLNGSIARLGSSYTLGLIARNCRTGDVLDRQQAQAESKENVLHALSQMAVRFRARAGESISEIEKHSTPLEEATTPSLAALKAFSMGLKALVAQGPGAAAPILRRATEIDPKFATAYAWLGRAYGGVGEYALALENTSKAWELRDRANDQERFYIDFSYYRFVKGDVEKAAQTCELWAQTYPRDVRAYGLLSGSTSASLARYERGAEAAKKALELDPDHSYAYTNLTRYYILRGRLGEAQRTLQRALERKLQLPDISILQYDIAFLNQDRTEMRRVAETGLEESGANDWLYDKESATLAYYGHLHQASLLSLRAVDVARAAGRGESAAQHEATSAVREALFGNASVARQSAAAARKLSGGRDAEYGAAVALALSGESSRSQGFADDLERRFPEDTSVKFSYLPVVRALLALNHGHPAQAIEYLELAAPYDFAFQGSTSVGFGGTLYPAYVRGIAFLAAQQGREAAAEFQKILRNGGLVGADPIGALARLQLGRAFVLAGDKNAANAAYRDFLTLWNDADPSIPILKQAKSEYSRLY